MSKPIIILILVWVHISWSVNSDFVKVVDLEGPWRFEIGDNERWAQPDFDDSAWEKVDVPATWEDEGFPGYDGYAWYRIRFVLTDIDPNKNYYLSLGIIDDSDETYLNGKLVGFSGGFPPDYYTAANQGRQYLIPVANLKSNTENVLAVRVYDDWGVGGIKRGHIALLKEVPEFEMEVNLAGHWKFKPGDDMKRAETDFDDSDWPSITVPGKWEIQGYRHLGGFAWYRTTFTMPADLKDERLILLLGKIDDLDETYLNGKQIGRTGIMRENPADIHINQSDWNQLRAYYIPRDYLNSRGKNVLAVRVFDGPEYGGIYEGPIGIITREDYLNWKDRLENSHQSKGLFEFLFGY